MSTSVIAERPDAAEGEDAFWRVLANPWRRRLFDLLHDGPRTTGDLAERLPEVSRYAVMQHLAGEGPMEDGRVVETPRAVRNESELRFRAPPERVFRALADPGEVLRWFPHTYGENRVKRLVLEPRVGGEQYEDWGDGRGYHHVRVTERDPPFRYAVRSRLHPGTVMDTLAVLEPTADGALLRSSRVVVGPISDEQERGIGVHGDLARFHDAIRSIVEADRTALRGTLGGRHGADQRAST